MLAIDIKKLIDIARSAGNAILEIYNNNETLDIRKKEDKSPLTKADLLAHNIIVNELKKFTPNIPLLSEESTMIDWEERKNWNAYWLIDPLDGTKEFINRTNEFTVNIALIDNHIPIAGVVYAPALDLLYFADKKDGAYKTENNKNTAIQVKKPNLESINVVSSRRHSNNERLNTLLKQFKKHTLINTGSSLKICLVAEGKADIYPRLGPTSEWDTAAAQAILESAGGALINLKKQPLIYNTKNNILNSEFIATSIELNKHLLIP